jgi:hypothetical protein
MARKVRGSHRLRGASLMRLPALAHHVTRVFRGSPSLGSRRRAVEYGAFHLSDGNESCGLQRASGQVSIYHRLWRAATEGIRSFLAAALVWNVGVSEETIFHLGGDSILL